MAMGQQSIAAVLFATPGFLAFAFGVVAENKKPSGLSTPSHISYDSRTDQSTCHYGNDPTIALGIVAVIFLLISTVLAVIALYYPYNGKRVPAWILWQNSGSLMVFTILGLVVMLVSEALFLWDVGEEIHHRTNNVHGGRIAECPTAKTGLFGGAGFLALDATLFFLTAIVLTDSARTKFLEPEEYEDEDDKNSYYSEFEVASERSSQRSPHTAIGV